MEKGATNVKVPLISKIAYGMGDVGCNFSWMFVGNFLMIFYTDVFGIGMGAVAALMLFSRFWDAINDPVIGALSDKTHTRWGRYRPWLLIAAPLTALVLILTFWAHPDWSDTSKIIYMAVTYCILVLGYTCVNIPYGTLCGAMTQNIEERAKINTFRSVSAMIAIGVINIITVPLISALGGGSDQRGYLLIAVIYGCIFAACHIFCFSKTKEVVEVPAKQKLSLKTQLAAAAKNKPYMIAVAGQLLFGLTLYGRNADALYYFTYVEGDAALFSTYSLFLYSHCLPGSVCLQCISLRQQIHRLHFTCSLHWHSFFSPVSILRSMRSYRTVWNTESGRQASGMTVSSMHSFHWAIKWVWRSEPLFLRQYLKCAAMWRISSRTLRYSV